MTLEQRFFNLAEDNPVEFYALFRRVRDAHPQEVTRACVRFIAKHGCGALWQKSQYWFVADSWYIKALLDPDLLDHSDAVRLGTVFRDADLQFFTKLKQAVDPGLSLNINGVVRVVRLYEGLGNAEFLVAWLRALTSHPDERVRSRVVKELCALRPNPGALERQVKSEDSRVRANAIEALWGVNDPDVVPILRSCLKDSSQRVVINALIGLYRLKIPGTIEKLMECGASASPTMRAAAIWGMNLLADQKTIPTLRKLLEDEVPEIGSKALAALIALGFDPSLRVDAPPELEISTPVEAAMLEAANMPVEEPRPIEQEPPEGSPPSPEKGSRSRILGL